MNLQQLQHGEASHALEFHHYGSGALGHWTSFGLIDAVSHAPTPVPSNWRTLVLSELGELTKLRRGWDGPNSGPISLGIAAFAVSILQSVMKPHSPAPAVVPGRGGAIQLEWHQAGLDIELMIYRPADAELSVQFHDGRPPIEDTALATNFEILGRILEELA